MPRTIAALALAATLAACSGSGGTTDSSPRTTGAGTVSPNESPPPQNSTARVGETLTLHGTEEGSAIEVTVAEVIDPYTLQSEVLVPEEGTRLIAFDLELTNAGTVAYSDAPGNGAVLLDENDVEWNSVISGEDVALVSVTMAPGDSDSGLIYFQLPEDLGIARLRLTLNSGYGPESGEWLLDGS
ncbi:MAG TPA: hypothetical protein VEO00_10710 [Actinomycetota bacterium]|nr:hypothetical protein [Actinomycetota bacterium]